MLFLQTKNDDKKILTTYIFEHVPQTHVFFFYFRPKDSLYNNNMDIMAPSQKLITIVNEIED